MFRNLRIEWTLEMRDFKNIGKCLFSVCEEVAAVRCLKVYSPLILSERLHSCSGFLKYWITCTQRALKFPSICCLWNLVYHIYRLSIFLSSISDVNMLYFDRWNPLKMKVLWTSFEKWLERYTLFSWSIHCQVPVDTNFLSEGYEGEISWKKNDFVAWRGKVGGCGWEVEGVRVTKRMQ